MPLIPSNNEPVVREPEVISIQNVSFIENERVHHLSCHSSQQHLKYLQQPL
jgi:hypothetical protein